MEREAFSWETEKKKKQLQIVDGQTFICIADQQNKYNKSTGDFFKIEGGRKRGTDEERERERERERE